MSSQESYSEMKTWASFLRMLGRKICFWVVKHFFVNSMGLRTKGLTCFFSGLLHSAIAVSDVDAVNMDPPLTPCILRGDT